VRSRRFCSGTLLFVTTALGACEDAGTDAPPDGSSGQGGEAGGSSGSATGGSVSGGSAGTDAGGSGGNATGGGSGDEGGGGGSPSSPECPEASEPSSLGAVAVAALSEASGIAASRRAPGVLYTHNDSGHPAEVFAVSEAGAHVATLAFAGALAHDWEDIAIGPGPDDSPNWLYVADIGDDPEAPWRETIVVERALEPVLDATEPALSLTVEFDSLYLRYPDGPHNAETLLVDPASGDLYLVTKEAERARVYVARSPLESEDVTELDFVTELSFGDDGAETGLVTGGDFSANGRWLVLRTESTARLWHRGDGVELETALGDDPCAVPVGGEFQGEAIGFAADGASYFTLGEGASPELFRVELDF
jgi:hypothetical protein